MKKLVLITVGLLLATPSFITAQSKKPIKHREDYSYIDYKKSEIYIQYGAPTILEITDKLDNTTYNKGTISHKYKETGHKYTGVAGVGYNFYLNPYVSLGAYMGISEADKEMADELTDKYTYKSHIRNYTGMVGINWTYFRSGIWEASCGASLGIAYLDETQALVDPKHNEIPFEDDSYNFAYNLTATRVRVGGGVLGGFMEVGFGYKGLVNAGVSVRF